MSEEQAEREHLVAELQRLRDLLDSRPAINSGLAETYKRLALEAAKAWHGVDCYYGDPYFAQRWVKVAQAVAQLVAEEAARICESFRRNTLSAQSGDSSELSNVMLRQVAELGHGECAAAIRSAFGIDATSEKR